MKNWYTIKAAAKAGSPAEVSIHDEIGAWGVTARSFIADLKAQSADAPSINLSINSPGGSVFDGLAIYNSLRGMGKPVNVTILGIAASMASVVAMAGTTISMPSNAMVMVHNAISGMYGDAEDLRDQADVLDKIDNSIVGIYVARTGKSEEDVRALMANDTFMSAAEALDAGFITAMTDEVKVTASFDIERMPENVQALFATAAAATVVTAAVVTPPAAQARPTAAEIERICADAGPVTQDLVAALVMDDKLADADALRAAAREAHEIIALCRVTGSPADATAHIRARRPLADVRAQIAAARVTEDEATVVRTAQASTNVQAAGPAVAIDTHALWAHIEAMKKTENTK